jgi:predicted ABC-type transport system involved in lysophospholipase L1 biosynthesis ATPase subunit
VAKERAGAVVVVTHDPGWAERCATIKSLSAAGLSTLAGGGRRAATGP